MHILITADTVGGVWTYSKELVTGLLRQGVRVTLVSFGDLPSPSQSQWIDSLPDPERERLAFYPTAFKLEWMQDSAADVEASADFLKTVIDETQPDLLHLSQFYYGALDCELPRIVVAHSDVVSWWLAVHGQQPPPSPWMSWYREIVARGLQRANAVIAPSHWMMSQVERHFGHLERALVIYNGRSLRLFNPYIAKQNTIVTAGRLWDAGKNAALILREPMPAPVVIVGAERHPETHGRAFSVAQRKNLCLESHKTEKEMAQILGRAGIYAALSQYGPFGLAPVEAALSRCAIVASDIPTYRELWQDNALFFRSNDSGDLRRVLASLVSDPDLRNQYAQRVFHHAVHSFNARSMVDEYMELYRVLARVAAVA